MFDKRTSWLVVAGTLFSHIRSHVNQTTTMQAILKGKHQRFCKWLQSIRDRKPGTDPHLDQLEEGMFHCYEVYMQKREELRKIIVEYEEKQKSIRNKIKEYKKHEFKMGGSIQLVTEKQT